MSTVRAFRCNVTRRTSACAGSAWPATIRPISLLAAAKLQEEDEHEESDWVALSKNEIVKSPKLDTVLGEEHTTKAKHLARDIRTLTDELDLIYDRQRDYKRTFKGPYGVRTTASSGAGVYPVHVRNNKVYVAETTIPNIWLRDNCQCSSCMHGATKQRLLDTFLIPKDITIEAHSLHDDVLQIEWSDGHRSEYSLLFLGKTTRSEDHKAALRRGSMSITLWDSLISSDPPQVDYRSSRGRNLYQLLRKIRKYGFCHVAKTPCDNPDATQTLLQRISFIRETHYGSFYDFTADLASKDTAYTNIALEAHTDNTYFSDPAGLQAFHLLSHTEGQGGASLLVDGFNVAEQLSRSDRKAYEVLSTVNVHAHASGNEGISIQPYRSFPVLEHDPATGDLLRVRWNSSDRASIELPIDQVEVWYDAARKFDALLKKTENEYWEQLKPGKVLLFDNWRVLHGRSSFTGKRRICGGYINRDDWISKFKMLQWGPDKVLGSLASS